ncbi:Cyclin-U4-1 [Capsicum chinense]|nr:Cyclin-U4-1 [Capsicum chinense]
MCSGSNGEWGSRIDDCDEHLCGYRPDDLRILIPVIPSLLASLEFRVQQYIERIFKYSDCSPSLFVVAYVYLERFLNLTGCLLTSLNVHRLLITSIMLDVKFVDNDCYNNHCRTEQAGDKTLGSP